MSQQFAIRTHPRTEEKKNENKGRTRRERGERLQEKNIKDNGRIWTHAKRHKNQSEMEEIKQKQKQKTKR